MWSGRNQASCAGSYGPAPDSTRRSARHSYLYAAAARDLFRSFTSRFRFSSSHSSADSERVTPGRTPSSMSATWCQRPTPLRDPEFLRDLGDRHVAFLADRDHSPAEFAGERFRHGHAPFPRRRIRPGAASTKRVSTCVPAATPGYPEHFEPGLIRSPRLKSPPHRRSMSEGGALLRPAHGGHWWTSAGGLTVTVLSVFWRLPGRPFAALSAVLRELLPEQARPGFASIGSARARSPSAALSRAGNAYVQLKTGRSSGRQQVRS